MVNLAALHFRKYGCLVKEQRKEDINFLCYDFRRDIKSFVSYKSQKWGLPELVFACRSPEIRTNVGKEKTSKLSVSPSSVGWSHPFAEFHLKAQSR